MEAIVYIPGSSYAMFVKEWKEKKGGEWKHLRYGQAFFDYFKMYKMTPRPDLNRLYESDDRNFVERFVDFNN